MKSRVRTVKLAISPCPNDTFSFEALISGRIDTEGLAFEVTFADIEQLNGNLLDKNGGVEISKMSYAALPLLLNRYALCDSGSALGYGVGPVMVAREGDGFEPHAGAMLAIPGRHTTANLLVSKFFPEITDKPEYIFHRIADAVVSGRADAGVMIHEGRFTYRNHGLTLVADLGQLWEKAMGMPLPLGGIVVSRALPDDIRRKVDRVIRRSIEYAMANPSHSATFVKAHAQEMDRKVIESHIKTFVNENSLTLGPEARRGICHLLGIAEDSLK